MKILIVTDAWTPQINGVVRTIQMTVRELVAMGHEVEILSPDLFRSIACPGYAEIRLALVSRRTIRRRMREIAPDALHLATEGPLGLHARSIALEHGWPFTTAYHTRFPEYLRARLPIPLSLTYAFLRRFHDAGSATLAATPAIVDDLLRARLRGAARVVARRRHGAVQSRRPARAARRRAGVPARGPHRGREAGRRVPQAGPAGREMGRRRRPRARAAAGRVSAGALVRRAAGRGAGARVPQRRREGVHQRHRHLRPGAGRGDGQRHAGGGVPGRGADRRRRRRPPAACSTSTCAAPAWRRSRCRARARARTR